MQKGLNSKLYLPSTFKSGQCSRPTVVRPRCDAVREEDRQSRRGILEGTAASLALLLIPKQALSAGKAQTTNVGSYLPKAGEGYVQFKPNETQTPVRINDTILFPVLKKDSALTPKGNN